MDRAADIVVAGAGHNCLITATYLATAGYSCLIVDARDELPAGRSLETEQEVVGSRTSRGPGDVMTI